ncbi:HAD-IC family P-type ATPase [Candidatus Saccharibacteria bacterium]|nr:HAD-IC family P-type ATPase [Candidatus Saccharibacteria bacterium]
MKKYKGLNYNEVRERRRAGLVNAAVIAPSKTVKEIIISNTVTYFNIVFLAIAIILVAVGSFRDLTFLPVIIANSLIGIIQELRAKAVLDKLTVLNAPRARVVRDGRTLVIPVEKLVLDDVVILKTGDQIPADAKVLSGEVAVNESLLTGEADEIMKAEGDDLLSGSFIIYGECYAKLTKVGADSYASQLTLKAKAIKTGEQSEIIRSLNAFVQIAGIAIIPIGIILFSQQYFFNGTSAQLSVQSMVAAVIGMIPEGLFLLASVTLVLSAMRLAQSKVLLHDMKSIETLARVDVLCVDKTGTITDDKMDVVDAVWLGENEKMKEMLPAMLGEVVANLAADNATMAALKKTYKRQRSFKQDEYAGLVGTMPFSSKYKYSGVQYSKAAFVIGAPEFVMRDDYEKVRTAVEKYSKRGYRVLVFGQYNGKLISKTGDSGDKALTAKVRPLAIIVLQNNIRETAPATFKYFAEQGVEVKVISGDDPETVSEVAKQAGIIGAEKYVNVTKLGSGTNFKKAVLENVVLGRVTPNQKRRIVNILREAGRTVAMVGDGVNDVLALKDADCSVAMASGSDAAVQASQLVLLESDFSKMPSVVREGRRVVNNLQRSGSLFLVKNIFSFIMALIAICFAATYPMNPTQVSLVTMFTIGVPSFFLAQIPGEGLIRGSFIKNVIYNAAPAALTNLLLIAVVNFVGTTFFQIPRPVLSTICTFVWSVVGLVYLIRLCKPFDKWKLMIVSGCITGLVLCCIFLKGIFGLEHNLGWEAWGIFAVGAILALPVMLVMERVFRWLSENVFEKYVINRINKLPSVSGMIEKRKKKHIKKMLSK